MASTVSGSRRRWRPVAWFAALVVAPLVEVLVIVGVARLIGGWPTFGLLVLESVVGLWLVRREGARAWGALRGALSTGRMPSTQVADAVLILIGGILIMLPGFVSGIIGLLVVLPLTRPLASTILRVAVARRVLAATAGFGAPVVQGHTVPPTTRPGDPTIDHRADGRSDSPPDRPSGRAGQDPDDDIIEGEIL